MRAGRLAVALVMATAGLNACASAREGQVAGPALRGVLHIPAEQPFAISLVPAVPVPIRIGAQLGFRLSSSTAGYAQLYLVDPVGEVWVLAENLPLAAGSLEYPSPAEGFLLAASEPVGVNRVILLVTRDAVSGFSGDQTLIDPVSLAVRGDAFVERLNAANLALPASDWAIDEIRVRIVA